MEKKIACPQNASMLKKKTKIGKKKNLVFTYQNKPKHPFIICNLLTRVIFSILDPEAIL